MYTSKSNRLFVLFFSLIIISGCTTKWTKTIRSGKVISRKEVETVSFENQRGLIFVPVTIRGKTYRFLFDTGAPLSISESMQKELNYKHISYSHIVDSDNNRKKVPWVRMDSLLFGNTLFLRQSAFVGDFEANPIIKCLGIDGILGSNLIRQGSWTIDPEKKTLSLVHNLDTNKLSNATSIPFEPNNQYSMFIDFHLGKAKVNHVLVDYGSNGSLAFTPKNYKALEDLGILSNSWTESGYRQSGVVGKAVPFTRKLTLSDSLRLNDVNVSTLKVSSGKTSSIGNKLLERYRVTIDWNHHLLWLQETNRTFPVEKASGFRLGFHPEKGIYVQSVLENSNAYTAGLRTHMQVLRLDSLDFSHQHNYCDYIDYDLGDRVSIVTKTDSTEAIKIKFERTLLDVR